MTVDYKISSDAPYTIIIEGEGSFAPFEEYMDGKVIETLDGKLCEIPFTPENATKLRQFLRGKDFEIPDREKALLAYLADHPEALDDKEINWTMELTELRHNKAPGRFTKIKTEWDLLHYMPLRYLDKTNPQSVSELVEGQWSVVTGVLVADPEYRPHGDPNKEFVKIVISDIKNTRISATFFRQKWLAWKFKAGDEVVLYGTFKIYSNPRNGARFPQMANAKIDKIDHNVRHNLNMVPIYPQKSEDKSWQLQVAQEKMINNIVWMEDPVPAQILKKYEFLSRNEAYRLIHFPNSREDVERASRRIAFDEFVRLQVFLANKKEGVEETPSSAKELHSWADAFTNSLPFDFTNAQNRVIGEITADLASQKPMYRLLQGDVGSGKALPLYAKVLTPSGYRLMKDMKVGDLVVTPSGGITSVVGAFPQKGKRPIYELQFDDGTKARSDLEHLWSVSQALEDEDGIVEYLPNKVITTKEIIKSGLKRYGSDGAKWFIDNPNFEAISGYLTLDASKPDRAVRKAITHIAYLGEEDAKCIKLADPSGLFITDDYTVTHNTEISSVATLIAAESGYQTALLAPTDILASQLYERLSKTFAKAGLGDDKVKFALINGRVKGKARTALLKEIKEGDITIVVGTHAILQKDVEFHNLGLVVIDEQHKFGAEQRSTLRRQDEHGRIPDLLTMSATPIPRTTSQVVYGDMDISIVDELPAERIPIETEWHETPDFAWSKIREEVEAGHQAYVVASLVEDTEKLENIESAQATYENLAFNVFPDLKVGLLHGRLGRDEKKEVIDRFYAKEIDILVATTVVEVGVNVPNATIMTILNANRFGIASLHQIRGRVGRGALKSYCYLIGEATSLEAEERLNALVESNDGFVLAEKDLEIRGEGSLFGQLQSGANDLFVGNLKEHKDLLDLAKRVAKQAKSSRILKAEVDLLYSGKEIRA